MRPAAASCIVRFSMRSVLYFHGFASSPASAKIAALRPLLAPHEIELDTPDLNVPSFEELDFDAVVAHATARAQVRPPRALVGSSLGALVALAVAKNGIAVPLVLIAPALGVARAWAERVPAGDPIRVFNFARNADAWIHRKFFLQMATLHVDVDPPPSRVTVIMGRNDETVPFLHVEQTWRSWQAAGLPRGSRFHAVRGGDHSLLNETGLIRDAIIDAVR